MRTYKITSTLVFYLLLLYVLVLTTACKKTSASDSNSPANSKFSFIYNGTQYVLPYKEGTAEWGIENSGIFINRPDLFNGIIHFPYANCAYLDPNTNGLSVQLAANCQLTASGMPIDSVAVYLYQSGLVNISYRNCSHKSEYDPYTGSTVSYDVCDANGTFDLILKNKENKTISINDGKFEVYRLKR
jgi:hypothetical protein